MGSGSAQPKKQLKEHLSTGPKPQIQPQAKQQVNRKSIVDNKESTISYKDDPIGATIQIRNSLGGLNANMSQADAKKKKVSLPVPLKLKAPTNPNQLLNLCDESTTTKIKVQGANKP